MRKKEKEKKRRRTTAGGEDEEVFEQGGELLRWDQLIKNECFSSKSSCYGDEQVKREDTLTREEYLPRKKEKGGWGLKKFSENAVAIFLQ